MDGIQSVRYLILSIAQNHKYEQLVHQHVDVRSCTKESVRIEEDFDLEAWVRRNESFKEAARLIFPTNIHKVLQNEHQYFLNALSLDME